MFFGLRSGVGMGQGVVALFGHCLIRDLTLWGSVTLTNSMNVVRPGLKFKLQDVA